MPAAMTIARPAKDGGYSWLDVNDAFEALSGWHRLDVLGRSSADIGLITAADLARTRGTATLNEGHVRDSECELRTKNGDRRTVLFSSEAPRSTARTSC